MKVIQFTENEETRIIVTDEGKVFGSYKKQYLIPENLCEFKGTLREIEYDVKNNKSWSEWEEVKINFKSND